MLLQPAALTASSAVPSHPLNALQPSSCSATSSSYWGGGDRQWGWSHDWLLLARTLSAQVEVQPGAAQHLMLLARL